MLRNRRRPINRIAECLQTCVLVGVVGAGVAALPATGAEVTLWNGVTGVGSLTVVVDDYGSFGHGFGAPDWYDVKDVGPQGRIDATAVFLFIDPSTVGNGTHRGVFSGHGGYVNTYDDGNLKFEIKQENSTDNLPTSTDSVIDVSGPGGIFLQVRLTQTIGDIPRGPGGEIRTQLQQTYHLTNTGDSTREWIILKHINVKASDDGGSFFLDELVGVNFKELERPQVFALDRELTGAILLLRTRDNHDPLLADDLGVVPNSVDFVYYTAKESLSPRGNPNYPGGDCSPFVEFGIWDSFGTPNCHKNHVPGVGYDVPGTSPQLSGDSYIGLQAEGTLEPGESYEVAFQSIYAQHLRQLFGDGDGDGDRDIDDFALFIGCVSGEGGTSDPVNCRMFDDEDDNDVDHHDFAAFQRVFGQ